MELMKENLRLRKELEEAKKRIDAHMTQEEKCQKSDYIIDNSKELCYTIEQVNEIIRKEE